MVWSDLVDQQKVDRLTGQNVIFDILEPPVFRKYSYVRSFKHSVFVFVSVSVFVLKWTVGVMSQRTFQPMHISSLAQVV